jgi:hypothetical protein
MFLPFLLYFSHNELVDATEGGPDWVRSNIQSKHIYLPLFSQFLRNFQQADYLFQCIEHFWDAVYGINGKVRESLFFFLFEKK